MEEGREVWFEGILNFDEGLKEMFVQQFRVEDKKFVGEKIFQKKEWLNFLTDSYFYQTRDIRLITVDKAKWEKLNNFISF